MPVLKTYKKGVWEPVFGVSKHTHTIDEITNFPSNLPVNGGDADTLDGKHAEEFALVSDVNDAIAKLEQKVNNTLTEETDPTVPAWAKQSTKPTYTSSEVGADPIGTASSLVTTHNTETDAHNDIRSLINDLTNRLNAIADSDDTTLDQMNEVVAYIKSNKSLIDAITTSKVNVSDVINNLTTNVTNKPLSAAQGVTLKALIDAKVVPSDSHINSLIDAKLASITSAEEVAF